MDQCHPDKSFQFLRIGSITFPCSLSVHFNFVSLSLSLSRSPPLSMYKSLHCPVPKLNPQNARVYGVRFNRRSYIWFTDGRKTYKTGQYWQYYWSLLTIFHFRPLIGHHSFNLFIVVVIVADWHFLLLFLLFWSIAIFRSVWRSPVPGYSFLCDTHTPERTCTSMWLVHTCMCVCESIDRSKNDLNHMERTFFFSQIPFWHKYLRSSPLDTTFRM